MHFEHTVVGQWVLFLLGAAVGLAAGLRPHGLIAAGLTAVPFVGAGLTAGFC